MEMLRKNLVIILGILSFKMFFHKSLFCGKDLKNVAEKVKI